MKKHSNLHMTTGDFRKQGHAVIDWIADYYDHIEDYPVFPKVQPGEIRASLPNAAPKTGRAYDDIMEDMKLFMPGITHWQSPNFHAYFPCATSGPAILGDLLSTGLGINGMNWSTSPSCTEVESHILDWIVDMMDLPSHFKTNHHGGGVIQDTASSSSLVALIAAREEATKGATNLKGCDQSMTVYTSSQSHSSIEKAVGISGIGKQNLRLVNVDSNFAMDIDHLNELIKEVIRKKFFLVQLIISGSHTCKIFGNTEKEINKKNYLIKRIKVPSQNKNPKSVAKSFSTCVNKFSKTLYKLMIKLLDYRGLF